MAKVNPVKYKKTIRKLQIWINRSFITSGMGFGLGWSGSGQAHVAGSC